jgi:membrane protein YqaA with SNARE-associated domain
LRWAQFTSWLKLTLPALGGFGLFLSAFVDASFVPLPLVTDLLLIELSSRHPLRMPYYAALAALGSLAGCIVIYWLARKGGQAYYRKIRGHEQPRIGQLIQKYPLASVFFPALAPFPVPFKPFLIAQGVFQVPFATFLVGTLMGRGTRFLIEGFLGARYGASAKQYLFTQKWASLAVALGLVLIILLVRRLLSLVKTELPQTH